MLMQKDIKISECIIEKLDRPESWTQPFQFSRIRYFFANIHAEKEAKNPSVLRIFTIWDISGKGNFHALPQTFKLNS